MRDADDHNVMLAGPEKSNVGRTDIPAARFNITPVVKFEVTAASDGTVGRLDFLGMSDRTIKQHLADGPALGGGESRTDPVDQWLTARLADGRVPSADITREADELDFGPGQLRGSKERLKVSSRKIGTTWYTGYEHQLVNHLVNLSSRHLDGDDEDDEMESQVDDDPQVDEMTKRQDDEMTCQVCGSPLGRTTGKCGKCILDRHHATRRDDETTA
jgi:hypothetical protein